MSTKNFQSAKFVREKQIAEIKKAIEEERLAIRERRMLLGYFVVALLSTLLISGAFKLF